MKQNHSLNSIYDEVKALGLIANQYDFSTMCGRTPAWFSAIKSRRLPITADAYLALSFNIKNKAEDIIDVSLHNRAVILSQKLLEQAQLEAGKKAKRMRACSFD